MKEKMKFEEIELYIIDKDSLKSIRGGDGDSGENGDEGENGEDGTSDVSKLMHDTAMAAIRNMK